MNDFGRDYFEDLYARDPDPWGFRSSAYERAKYAATLAALTRDRYRCALELGCSIGELSQLLAPRCDRLVAVDTSAIALDIARQTCAAYAGVEFVQAHLPHGHWQDDYDLVVLSEVLYYLTASDVQQLADRLASCLHDKTELILVHWTGDTNYPLSGDAAVALFADALGNCVTTQTIRTDRYRLDRWVATG